jgi:DNA adenine methylase
MEEHEHVALAKALHRIRGLAAVSGYRCDLMDELYDGWRRYDAEPKRCHSIKTMRQESLWMNY